MPSAFHPPASTGLYVSVPFCRSKCTFCNFASGVYPVSELPRYVERVIADLRRANANAEREGLLPVRAIDTIYFGGGTPSLLTPAQLGAIFAAIRECFDVEAGAEVTIEAAPSFLPDDLLRAAVELGVTRISFGVQSFVEAETRAVGRLHRVSQAMEDLSRGRRAGLAMSVDLIAGLPGQNPESWRRSLATLVEAAPEHASVYMLEVDQDSRLGGEMLLGGTRYGAGLAPSEDAVAEFYEQAVETLARGGLAQYEISNFARPGAESRHNLRYWQRRPYLGVGLDAHSMLRSVDGQPVRFATTADLGAYLSEQDGVGSRPFSEFTRLSPKEALEEAFFLGLRRNCGVALDDLREEFGAPAVQGFQPILEELVENELLVSKQSRLALTARGRLVSNEVFARLLADPEPVPAG